MRIGPALLRLGADDGVAVRIAERETADLLQHLALGVFGTGFLEFQFRSGERHELALAQILDVEHQPVVAPSAFVEERAVRHADVQAVCCKRAYLRGAFLSSGSMSDPGKSYHFEIVCNTLEKAQYLQQLMQDFGLEARIVRRKKNIIVYLKEGDRIVDALNVMDAPVALMELENVRILKDMRNNVNRKVNCETANINKTVSAAVKQRDDIEYIRDTVGLSGLPDGLRDVALTRLAYPDASLKELGELLENPVGKSGVNHRLRKLSEMADKLRDSKEVQYDQETSDN